MQRAGAQPDFTSRAYPRFHRVLLYLAARTTIDCRPEADLRRADLQLLKLRPHRRFWNLRAEPRSQPFNRSRESRDDFLCGIWSS